MPNLIGTGNNQVPTNGMLGGLAYQSPDNAVIKNLELTNLSGHNSLIPSNAVDVFVYDTRKDSDGGAWRKRTQHTSWYNEPLNTATRGSRRDFPAVAVIVATSTSVTIYDGDDPDMPMWMVFNKSSSSSSFINYNVSGSLCALNGQLTWSVKDTDTVYYGHLCVVDFISELMIRRTHSYNGFTNNYRKGTGVSGRNTGFQFILYIDLPVLADLNINDVAMTVLPNAPIDPSTGLPIPTIAVATSGGVSIIRDDGTVANITPNGSRAVSFDKNNGLWINFTNGGSAIGWYYYTNFTSTSSYSSIYHNNSGWSASWDMLGGVVYNGISYGYSSLTTGTSGLSNFDGFGVIKASTTMSNFITTSYNTGWMHGDIKGAWLSDTSTASVTGTELITNGTFDSNTTGWTANTSTNAWSSGAMQITRSGGGGLTTYQSFTTVAGQRYVATASVNSSGSRGDLYIVNGTGWGGTTLGGTLGTLGQTKQLIVYFTATSTTTTLGFTVDNNATSITVDNVSVRREEADRSVNNTGLAVYGTITKTAVATGADLVEYSGWSKSNYLLRPEGITDLNNSSMTFMTWYKCSSINAEEALISTGDYNTISEVRALYIAPSGIAGFSGWANDFTPGSRSVRDDVWHHIAFTLQYISGNSYVVSIYVDGVLTGTSERTLLTFSNTAIDIGGGTLPLDRFARGSLALSRVSTSVVSASQMLKIYNDEKALFQPNSQCTLYGSSDAVTALAYDETTKLLHVGTSSGRSDFQGLERVANTTTAVTTAISASNGLIAEQ